MRRTIVAVAACVLAAIPATALSAGGIATFEFEDDYVLIGETVTGMATFQPDVRGSGRIEDGPWHAYLLPEGHWIDPPGVPNDAIPLGPIDIRVEGRREAVATVTFTVPDVALGGYHLGLCDVPCTESMVGDLGGGWAWITRTEEGAALLREVHGNERLLYRFRSGQARQGREAERTVSQLESQLDGMEGAVELRLTELEDRLRAALAAERETGGAYWAPALLAAAVVAAAVLFARRRRRLRLDPIPQEPPVVEWEIPEEVSART
jgi:hypothetical protein